MALLLPLVVVAAVLLLALAALSTRRHSTWRKKGVPYVRPWPLVGNSPLALLQREPIYSLIDRIYRKFPGKPYAGFYAGPTPVLIVKDLEAIKQVTIKDFHAFPDHKLCPDFKYDATFNKFLFCMREEEWKPMRVKMTPAFSTARLKAMYTTIEATAENLLQCIRRESDSSGVLNVSGPCTRYGIDVIAACAFGIESKSLASAEQCPYMEAVGEAMRLGFGEGLTTFSIMFVPALYHALRLPLLPEWRCRLLTGLLRESAEHRDKQPPASRDIFDNLLSLRRSGDVSNHQFEAQVVNMQVAGSETSAKTIMMALWLLAVHPECQDKLRRELNEASAKAGGKIHFEHLRELKYMDMVFKETLRLWPILPWLDRVATQDYVLPGTSIKIEKGTLVMVPVYSIHMDPDHYANPKAFDPERWAPENAGKINKLAWLPFGSGPRACIGSRFADMSVKEALYRVITTFRLSAAEGTPKSSDDLAVSPYSFLIYVDSPIPLRFEPL